MRDLEGNLTGLSILLLLLSLTSPILAVCFAVYFFVNIPSNRNAVACSIGIAFSAALIAHGIVYKHDVDMTRWMLECEYYDGKGILSIWNSLNEDHNGLLVWNLLCWITGNSGDLRLLQSLAAFMGYGLISWTMMNVYAKERTKPSIFVAVLVFLFLAIPVQPIVGNVRSALGCLLCAAAFCSRTSYGPKGSIGSLVLIAIACLIHFSMVLPLAIFIFQPLISRKPLLSSIACALVLFIGLAASPILLEIGIFGDVPVVSNILQKAAFYSSGTQWDQEMAKDFLSNLSHVLSLLMLGLICLRLFRLNLHNNLASVTLLMIACVVVMEFSFVNVGNRLKYIPIMLFSVLMIEDGGKDRIASMKLTSIYDAAMFTSAFIVCLISMYRFIPSFNYIQVIFQAVFFPLSYI